MFVWWQWCIIGWLTIGLLGWTIEALVMWNHPQGRKLITFGRASQALAICTLLGPVQIVMIVLGMIGGKSAMVPYDECCPVCQSGVNAQMRYNKSGVAQIATIGTLANVACIGYESLEREMCQPHRNALVIATRHMAEEYEKIGLVAHTVHISRTDGTMTYLCGEAIADYKYSVPWPGVDIVHEPTCSKCIQARNDTMTIADVGPVP